MIGLVVVFTSLAHAQLQTYPVAGTSGFANNSCAYVQGTRFESIPNVPGCTIKRMSPSGDAVTFQMKMPIYGPDGQPKIMEKTYTQMLERAGGKVVSMTLFEGDDLKKAASATTTVVNPDASLMNSNLIQLKVRQRENGKESKYLIYDRNLCARFKEAGGHPRDMALLQQCANVLPKFEDAAREWSNQLKKEKTELGVVAGFNKQGYVYRPAATGSISDLMQIVSACQQFNPDPVQMMPPEPEPPSPRPGPGPHPRGMPAPAPGGDCPNCRPASADSAI